MARLAKRKAATGLPAMRVLDFGGCTALTDRGLSAVLTQCPALQSLDCRSVRVGPASLAVLRVCTHLTELNANFCGISAADAAALRAALPSLKYFTAQ